MPKPRLVLRLFAIQRVLVRHGLDELVWRMHLFRPVAWMQRLLFWRRGGGRGLGHRLRLALEELGPVFVKFGQAVSVRRDLLPPEVADELAKLQDRVPPFSSAEAVAMLEAIYQSPLEQRFAHFEPEPLAAASIAQVHAAELPDGTEVVVKLLRPNVRGMIRRDLEVLFAIADLAEAYWPAARRLRPREVVAEFERTLYAELDLLREAGSAAQLKRNFEGSDKLYVPEIYWEHSRTGVLVMERIRAEPIGDVATLKARGADIKRLAENGVDIFFTQVFRHNFFHADMHPGNIFVDLTEPERPRYVAVDFGIVGSLSGRDQHYLAENFLAFFQRDYRRVAMLHVSSGWVPEDTRVDELESAIRAVCEPIFNKPLKEISFGLVLMRLFETARQFDMAVQPQLVLLQKTLLAIEGLGRELYPDLDLWSTAKPILEDWMRERRDPRRHLKQLAAAWPQLSEDLLLLPELLHGAIRRAEEAPELEIRRARAARAAARSRQWQSRFTAAVVLLAGVFWTGLAAEPIWLGWLASGAGLAWLVSTVVR